MATDIVMDPNLMETLQEMAHNIRSNHIMFATDKVFETLYIQELALWQEGMPVQAYNFFLQSMGIQPLPEKFREANVFKLVQRDIPVLGRQGPEDPDRHRNGAGRNLRRLHLVHEVRRELPGESIDDRYDRQRRTADHRGLRPVQRDRMHALRAGLPREGLQVQGLEEHEEGKGLISV